MLVLKMGSYLSENFFEKKYTKQKQTKQTNINTQTDKNKTNKQ